MRILQVALFVLSLFWCTVSVNHSETTSHRDSLQILTQEQPLVTQERLLHITRLQYLQLLQLLRRCVAISICFCFDCFSFSTMLLFSHQSFQSRGFTKISPKPLRKLWKLEWTFTIFMWETQVWLNNKVKCVKLKQN